MRIKIIIFKADNQTIAIRTNYVPLETIINLLKENYDEVAYVQTNTPEEYRYLIQTRRISKPDHFISTTNMIWTY